MTKSEQEEEAQARLDAAVVAFGVENGWDGFCDSYILVAHQHVVGPDGDLGNSRYWVTMMGGNQPDHTCIGLLQIGDDRIRGIGRWGKDAYDED